MKSKSAAKSKTKPAGAGAKLASSLKNAIFGHNSGKTKQLDKASPKKQPMKASSKPAKSAKVPAAKAAAAKPTGKAQPAKAVTAKAASAKPAAPVKAAKGAKTPPPAPAKATAVKATPVKVTAPKKPAAPISAAKAEANKRGVAAAAGKALANAKAAKSPHLARSPISSGRGLSDSEVCREIACEGLSTTAGYCRLHYIKNWRKIKRKEIILKEGKLNQYIEELVAKYPDKYIEAIRQDLATDKEFSKVISDLDLDESSDDFEGDGENVDALIDTIKRDFDDEGDAF
jgi:hypothetical protein